MRRWIALLLALGMLLSLCACGGTEEAKPVEQTEETTSPAALVEQQIGALGVIGLEIKDAIEAAEAAWAALSPAEQAEVHNYAVLQAARLVYDDAAAKQAAADAEAAYAAAIAPFVGTWIAECPYYTEYYSYEPLTISAEAIPYDPEYPEFYSFDPDSDSITIYGTTYVLFQEDGFTKLLETDLNGSFACAYVREEDLAAAREKKYVSVELDSENLSQYVGDLIYVGQSYNEWGELTNNKVYQFESLAYRDGLVFIGNSEDFLIEMKSEYWSQNWNGIFGLNDGSDLPTGKVRGTLYFIRAEYILDNTVEYDDWGYSGMWGRVLYLTDRERIATYSGWGNIDADYNDFKY